MVSTTEVKAADSVGSVGVGKSGFLDGLEECISLSHKQKQKELNRAVFPKMGTLKTTHLAPVSARCLWSKPLLIFISCSTGVGLLKRALKRHTDPLWPYIRG